jgi:hypothetical protein
MFKTAQVSPHHVSRPLVSDLMKWLLILLIALVATALGIMFSEGAAKYVFQMAFFGVLALSFLTLTLDISKT